MDEGRRHAAGESAEARQRRWAVVGRSSTSGANFKKPWWTCATPGRLSGCGLDAERVSRFRDRRGGLLDPWSAVFTEREVGLARRTPDPATALCACFCCKEALLKALGTPFDYRDCELLFSLDHREPELRLAPSLLEEYGLSGGIARFEVSGALGEEECVVAVCVFGRGP